MVFKLTIEKKDPDMGKPRAKVLRQRKEQGGKTLRGRMNEFGHIKERKGQHKQAARDCNVCLESNDLRILQIIKNKFDFIPSPVQW